ncbi:MAG: hypothetical protein ACQES9_03280 [Myxococcota bacterium]
MNSKTTGLTFLIFLFTSFAGLGCKESKRDKRRKKSHKKLKTKHYKKYCKQAYKRIRKCVPQGKETIKKHYTNKKGFLRKCKASQHFNSWQKLLKCTKKQKKCRRFKKCIQLFLREELKLSKKAKDDKKKRIVEIAKRNLPGTTQEEALKSGEKLGKFLFKNAFKNDFSKIEKIMLKPKEGKAFAKDTLFKTYADPENLKKKFKTWVQNFDKTIFKQVKIRAKDIKTIKPGDKSKKFKELGAALTSKITIVEGKILSLKNKNKSAKCSFVGIKLKENDWRLLRLKSCKIKRKKK